MRHALTGLDFHFSEAFVQLTEATNFGRTGSRKKKKRLKVERDKYKFHIKIDRCDKLH